jgi:type I restriction enzyme S subunit
VTAAVLLGSVLTKSDNWIEIDPLSHYTELTIHLWGRGVSARRVVEGAEIAGQRRLKVLRGEFVVSRIDARHGAFGVIPDDLDGAVVSNDFPAFRPNPERLVPEYLGWLSKTHDFVQACRVASEGTTNRVRLKEEKFGQIEIPLPPLAEQRRIVAKIERLAAKIEGALGLHHLSSKETAFSPQNISGSIFFELQRRFGTTAFRSFDPHISSGPRNWSQYYANEGPRFYRAQDIGPNGEIVDTNPQFIQPPANGQGRSARLEGNDIILVITGATIGRIAVFTPQHAPGLVNQHVGLCRFPLDRVCVSYVLWGLRCPIGQAQLLRDKYGQGKPGLNLNNIRSIKLPFPPISEQRRTAAYLNGLQAKVDRLKALQAQTRAELDALLPSILDRAFKGEL